MATAMKALPNSGEGVKVNPYESEVPEKIQVA